jgi:hypothetical protein
MNAEGEPIFGAGAIRSAMDCGKPILLAYATCQRPHLVKVKRKRN